MSKTFLRNSKASSSTIRKIERAIARGWFPGCRQGVCGFLKPTKRRKGGNYAR